MKKSAVAFMGIMFAGVCGFSSAWGAAEDDWKELGIESEQGATSSDEAIGKATTLNKKFEQVKGHVAEAFGGASATAEVPSPAKTETREFSLKESKEVQEAVYAEPSSSPRNDIIRLKNGQELSGVTITETTDKGYWVEMEGGRVFFDKNEVVEIKKQQNFITGKSRGPSS